MGDPASVLLVHGPSTGGIRRHVEALAFGLSARGWAVTVASVPRGGRAWTALRRRAAGHDVVHAHGLAVGWWASLVPSRPPLVVTVHNVVLDEVAGWKAPLLRPLEARLRHRVDAVIATSVAVGRRVGGAVTVIRPVGPPPVPARSRDEVRRAHGVAPGAPLVVVVARLHPQKGLDDLLDAVPRLAARVPGVRVVIVGEGPLDAHLRARIAAEDLSAVVALAGPTADAAGELAAADVVVVPSRWESGPLVVTEAMALGRPVVATPVGFVPEVIVDGHTGRLVAIGDPAALAAAMADVLTDPEGAAALGRAGQDRVRGWLDRDAAIDAVIGVYDAVRRR